MELCGHRPETYTFDEEALLQQYPLSDLDPTQRVFTDRVLRWAVEVVAVYKDVHAIEPKRTTTLTFRCLHA